MEPLCEPGKKGPVAEVSNKIKCGFPEEMLSDPSDQEEPTADEVTGFKLRRLAAGADRESHVKPEATARNERDDHIRGGNEDGVGDHLISNEAWQDGCSTYDGTVDKVGAPGRGMITNYAQGHCRWRFSAADIRYRNQEMVRQGEKALVTQQRGRGTVDKRKLIRREIVTRT